MTFGAGSTSEPIESARTLVESNAYRIPGPVLLRNVIGLQLE